MQNFSDMLEGRGLIKFILSSPHIITYLFIKVKSASTPEGSRIAALPKYGNPEGK